MKLSNENVKTGLACLAVVAMGAGLSLLSPATVATTASADKGATTYSSDTLLMHDEVSYSADGITFKITVPDGYQDIIGECVWNNSNVFQPVRWDAPILITRAKKMDGYTNPTVREEVSYGDFTALASDSGASYYYANYNSNVDYEIESFFFTKTDKIVRGENVFLLPEFDENNTAYFTIPHSSDTDEEYYYYAQVVEVWHSVVDCFLWKESAHGVSLTANIPCEGDMIYSSEKDFAKTKLEDESISLTDEERQRLQECIGVPTYGEQVETTIHYKGLASNTDPTSVMDKATTILLPAEYAQRKEEALEQFELYGDLNNTWGGSQGTSYFNVKFSGEYKIDDTKYETGNRIILQVDPYNPYTYIYDYETNTASVTVNYVDYQYHELALKVTNNDPDDEQELTMSVYTTDLSISGNIYTLTWDYGDVSTYMLNSAGWICHIKAENIIVTESEYWTISVSETSVSVSFDFKNQNKLVNLTLEAVAEIIADYECEVVLYYTDFLGWDSKYHTMSSDTVKVTSNVMYSETRAHYKTFDNFKKMDVYEEVLKKTYANGVQVAIPVGIEENIISDTNTIVFTVLYERPKFFVLENNLNKDVFFVSVESTSLTYKGEDIVKSLILPDGYRIANVDFDTRYIKVTNDPENPDNYKEAEITIKKNSEGQFYLANIEYTDVFCLEIEYFETYVSVYGKETPFAVKKTLNTKVKVSDFSGEGYKNGIYDIKYADVCRLLGKENLIVCEIINADSDFNVEYDSVSTYKVSITYSKASVRLINEHGTITENSIPLTRYVDWLEMMGNDDWTILMLNNEKNKYFRFSNDVAGEELYGLFSVAFFEKQVSDIADWFEKETENGCAVLWETEEVYGSDFYKWCQSTQWKTFGFSETCMWLCEVFDTSQPNATLKYKFFYIDETVDGLYLSNGGADNDHDNDNSLINGGQDLWDGITGGINQFLKSGEEIFVVLRIVAGVALAGGAVFLVIWGLSKLGIIKSKTVMVEQKPKTGRKDEGKKK